MRWCRPRGCLACIRKRGSRLRWRPQSTRSPPSHIGQDTPYPSLEVATAQGHGVGSACERGYGCSYSGTLSFRTASTPLPVESNPRQLFLRLFGQGDTPEERRFLASADRQHPRHDFERGGFAEPHAGRAGPRNAQRLPRKRARDRAPRAERRTQGDVAKLALPEVPGATSENFDEHLKLMFDLIALAYQGNLTRIQSFMLAPEVSEQTYNHIGVPDAFHALSHHANDEAQEGAARR